MDSMGLLLVVYHIQQCQISSRQLCGQLQGSIPVAPGRLYYSEVL